MASIVSRKPVSAHEHCNKLLATSIDCLFSAMTDSVDDRVSSDAKPLPALLYAAKALPALMAAKAAVSAVDPDTPVPASSGVFDVVDCDDSGANSLFISSRPCAMQLQICPDSELREVFSLLMECACPLNPGVHGMDGFVHPREVALDRELIVTQSEIRSSAISWLP